MRLFYDATVSNKLTLLMAVSSGVALLLATLAFAYHEVWQARDSKVRELTTLADVLGAASAAAMTYDDSNTIATTLERMGRQKTLASARIYTRSGALYAALDLETPGAGARVHVAPSHRGFRSDNAFTVAHRPARPLEFSGYDFDSEGRIEIFRPIVQDGKWLATVHLQASTADVAQQLLGYFNIAAVVFILSLAVGVVVSARLQKFVTTPILNLAETAKKVSLEHDYSLRVEKMANDELGTLCDCFNEMLEHIQHGENELQRANDELERRVDLRTAQLNGALDNARAASHAKTNFLANMSHEIRTPMSAIIGFSDNLLDEQLSEEERREALQTIRRNGEHLLGIINDILDISKIEAGKFQMERLRYSPCGIVGEVASLMRARAKEKNLEFDMVFDSKIPTTIETDPQRLRQILINLMGNAIKFTEKGSVSLHVRLEQDKEGKPITVFEVQDTGIGMTAEQCENIFQPFNQGDESMSRRFGGTGLGLTISRRFANMLGGDIEVTSEPGKGSTFCVKIDPGSLNEVPMVDDPMRELAMQSDQEPLASHSPTGLDCHILLAEDGPDNQRLISFILKKAGAQVTVVENGELALTTALAAANEGTPYDVILMDMQMPVRDGYSATSELRHRGYTGPIIALTAHAMSGAREKCVTAGCDDYASKPIQRAELIAQIAEQVKKHREPSKT